MSNNPSILIRMKSKPSDRTQYADKWPISRISRYLIFLIDFPRLQPIIYSYQSTFFYVKLDLRRKALLVVGVNVIKMPVNVK